MRSGPSWKKKEKKCDPSTVSDVWSGDQWDHTAIAVDSRFVVSIVVGKRGSETTRAIVKDFAERTNGKPAELFTSDDCNLYTQPLIEQYGETIIPERTGRPGRPKKPYVVWPEGSTYATVKKNYQRGTVSGVKREIVLGSEESLARALQTSQERHIRPDVEVTEGVLNLIEMAFRAYDPCFGCATHALPGQMAMVVEIKDSRGRIIKRLMR